MKARKGICILCGQSFAQKPTGRRRRYCSRACQERAYRLRRSAGLWRATNADPAVRGEVANLLQAAIHERRRRAT
jgi:hypothetical protein